MGHAGFIIPWVYHFLRNLQTLLVRLWHRRFIEINDKCKKDLELMQTILEKSKEGIDMNLLAFRSPDRIYYSNSCPAGLGGYSNQGHAWRFKISDDVQFRATNNSLKFLTAIIMPWIDIINGRLKPGDCALLMTNSTRAKGWMKKSNFDKHSNTPIQVTTHVDAERHYAQLFMDAYVKGYSQWFSGKNRIMSWMLSHKTGTGTTTNSPQFYVFISPNRC
jgi:hypothetical protein